MHTLVSGWQLFSLSTLASGSPFTIYSGIQQTGAGAGNADRPDQIARPVLSTGRRVREAAFQAPASLSGAYGSFTFDPSTGAWTYTLDNSRAAVQALSACQQVSDSLTVTSWGTPSPFLAGLPGTQPAAAGAK